MPRGQISRCSINGQCDPGADYARFSYSQSLAGADPWIDFSEDLDPCDGFSADWDPTAWPQGDYNIRMTQYSGGSPIAEDTIHMFPTPSHASTRQVLIHDNFDEKDINDWIIDVNDGSFEPNTSNYKSSPSSLKVYFQGDGLGNVCDQDCPNLDGENPVGLIGFSILGNDWQVEQPDLATDLNGDGTVNIYDLGIIMTYWLSDCLE